MTTKDPLVIARAKWARMHFPGMIPDPKVADAIRREIKELVLERHVLEAISDPPLTKEQRSRIAAILVGSQK